MIFLFCIVLIALTTQFDCEVIYCRAKSPPLCLLIEKAHIENEYKQTKHYVMTSNFLVSKVTI